MILARLQRQEILRQAHDQPHSRVQDGEERVANRDGRKE